MSAARRRPEDDALALFCVIIVIIAIVSLVAGCLHREPETWPGYFPPDSTRCAPAGERCT